MKVSLEMHEGWARLRRGDRYGVNTSFEWTWDPCYQSEARRTCGEWLTGTRAWRVGLDGLEFLT